MATPFSDIIRENTATINDLDLWIFTQRRAPLLPSHHREDLSQLLHTHFFYEIFIGVGGRVEIALGDSIISIDSGDVAIIPPGYTHLGLRIGEGRCVAFGFFGRRTAGGDGKTLYCELENILTATAPLIWRGAGEECRGLISLSTVKEPEGSPIPIFRLAEGLLRLAALPHETVGARSPDSRRVDHDVTRIACIEEMINSRFTMPYDPDALAASLYITRRHLDRIVRAHYGKTLRSLVNARRIRLAERLLTETDLTLSAIAERAGFGTSIAMKKAFLAENGISPREFREKGASATNG